MHFTRFASALTLATTATAWLPEEVSQNRRLHARDLPPSAGKAIRAADGTNTFDARSTPQLQSGIRGVNLGSLFVFEPWIAESEWSGIGCGGAASEFDCGKKLGQDGVNQAFQKHWAGFYTQADFDAMKSYGLNTVRIPVGYWMREDIVDRATEPFPQGGFDALKKICGMAAQSGLFVIVDQHGAPGAQVASNADTGQNNPNPGFFNAYNFERGLKFLEWMATEIHNDTTGAFRTVGMLEVINEPAQGNSGDDSMRQQFYPQAETRVRAAEQKLGVGSGDQLTLFYMNKDWGAGEPSQYLSTPQGTAYDDHRYIKWANNQQQTKDAYKQTSCNDDRGGEPGPTVVGEWSMSAPLDQSQQSSADWDPAKNKDWYAGWFAAQVVSYAKQYGWIYWTWKTQLNDPRWDYQLAVQQGIIPKDFSQIQNTRNSFCGGS